MDIRCRQLLRRFIKNVVPVLSRNAHGKSLRQQTTDNRQQTLGIQWVHRSLLNLLGPEYPVVSRVKNQYIKQMIIKVNKDLNINKVKDFIGNTIENFKHENEFKSVKIQIDVDPS